MTALLRAGAPLALALLGASVTRDGHHRFRTTFIISGLPRPESRRADTTTCIAWAAPPNMHPW